MHSVFEWINSIVGRRLIMKAVLTVCVIMVGVDLSFFDVRGSSRGIVRVVSVIRVSVLSIVSITFTWICTKVSGS